MLDERGIPCETIYPGDDVTMSSLRAASGKAKVPHVFIDGRLVGGSDELALFIADAERSGQ
jgi:glutathione-dependent peroxiredoxin